MFSVYIKRKALLLSAKKKIARNHQKRSRLFFCCCVRALNQLTQPRRKQFNFLFHETSELSFGRKKRQPGLVTNTQKRREKERKRERKRVRERKERRIFHKSANENVLFFVCKNRSETKFSRERKLYSFTPYA